VRTSIVAALAAAVAAAAGCSGSGSGEQTSIRLVVPDKNIREEGVECAGARPFQHIHAGATYTIENADGTVVEGGELPAGHAENAEPEIDWGVDRIPTFCVLELEVDLPKSSRYRLRLEGSRPLEFVAGDEPVVVVVS
jgi:hypothetical protein